MKKISKKVVAILLALVLVVPCTYMSSSAETNFDSSKILTSLDMGIEDKVYDYASSGTWLPANTTVSGGFDGKIFSTDVTFSEGESCIRIGGKYNYSGLNFTTKDADTLYLNYINSEGYTSDNLATFNSQDLGFDSIGTKFNLKVSIDYIDNDGGGQKDDVKVGVFFNDKLYKGQYVYLENLASDMGENFSIVTGASGGCVQLENPVEGVLYLSDFCGQKEWTETAGTGAATFNLTDNLTSLINHEFAAKVKISPTAPAKLFIGSSAAWTDGFILQSANTGWPQENLYFRVPQKTTGYYTALYIENNASHQDIPSVSEEFEVRVRAYAVDHDKDGSKDDLAVSLFINDKLWRNQMYYENDAADKMGTNLSIWLDPGASLSMKDLKPQEVEKTYETMTPNDIIDYPLNVANQTWTTDGSNAWGGGFATGMSILDREFVAKVNFSGNAKAQICLAGASMGCGLVLKSDPNSKNLVLTDALGAGGYSLGVYYELTPEKAGIALVDNEFELRIRVETVEHDQDGLKDDVALTVLINGTPYVFGVGSKIYIDDVKGNFGEYMYLWLDPGASLTLKAPVLTEQVTPEDFGIASISYSSGSTEGMAKEASLTDAFYNKVFSADVKFSKEKAQLHLGAKQSGYGIILKSDPNFGPDNLILLNATNESVSEMLVLSSETAGVQLTDTDYNMKFSFQYCARDIDGVKNDLLLGIYFKDKLYDNTFILVKDVLEQMGDMVNIYTDAGASLALLTPEYEPGTTENLDTVYYDISENPYILSSTGRIRVNDISYMAGDMLSSSGDYAVRKVEKNVGYVQNVYLWKNGDAHPDDQLNACDLVAVLKKASGTALATKSGEKAADVDGNGTVNSEDAVAMRKLLLGVSVAVQKKNNPVLDENVMPICGFYGPYDTYTYTETGGTSTEVAGTVNEATYQLIKEAGINLITSGNDDFASETNQSSIEKQLEFCDNLGLSMYVQDSELLQYPNDNAKIAARLALYNKHKSFAGICVADEPGGKDYPSSGSERYISDYADIMKTLNGFSNTMGYVNLLPYHNNANTEYPWDSLGSKEQYEAYLEEYCTEMSPKMISFDYYTFNSNRTDKEFFENLAMIRSASAKNGIPFWTHVQTGQVYGQKPTEGQLKWNVNVGLAFGAKGIQYFPLLQPYMYRGADNGLIKLDGTKGYSYETIKSLNAYIAKIDEVLMNAESKGVIAMGQTKTDMDGLNCMLTTYDGLAAEGCLNSYGKAMMGCFDYKGKTALYVVNCDTTNNLYVYFDGNRQYQVIAEDGESTGEGMHFIKENVAAGEAFVLILE